MLQGKTGELKNFRESIHSFRLCIQTLVSLQSTWEKSVLSSTLQGEYEISYNDM